VNRFWFRPKTYGYGVTPISWEGWAITLAYVAVVLAGVLGIAQRNTATAWLSAIAVIVLATGAMVFVGRQKTDGDWRWRWGRDDNSGKAK
jgi:uncharacterized membrane protein